MDVESQKLKRLDTIIKLLAAIVVKDKIYKEQVALLSSLGMQPKEIALLLGTTGNQVRVTLSRIKKQRNG
jgi:DNA-directed RNA polymerase specialized sigma24 family protein